MAFTQENVTKEEIEIRKQGWTTFKADFKPFNLAISPRLEALLLSGERLASLTDSPLFPSQLSLQLVAISSQVTSSKENSSTLSFLVINFPLSVVANSYLLCGCNEGSKHQEGRQKQSSTEGHFRTWC